MMKMMTEDWGVEFDGTTHAVHAEIIWSIPRIIKITWDGDELKSFKKYVVAGKLASFKHNGHSFVLRDIGVGPIGSLVLSQDGDEVPKLDLVLIEEHDVRDSYEVLAIDRFQFDNLLGDQPIRVVREASREATNELTVDVENEKVVGVGVSATVTAQISTQITEKYGVRIGETVRERQQIEFGVGPHSALVIRIIWKRRVITAERNYLLRGKSLKTSYRTNFGLAFDQETSLMKTGENTKKLE